jgi:hypothetical protein
MKKLLLIALLLIAHFVSAQHETDSSYIASVDSLIKSKQEKISTFEQKQFKDSLNFSRVTMSFDEGKLVTIYVKSISCEESTFHIKNDSLICVKYKISDPDIRSSLPPSNTFIIYFKNNKEIFSSESSWFGGAKTCGAYAVKNKNFLIEFYYYLSFYKSAK